MYDSHRPKRKRERQKTKEDLSAACKELQRRRREPITHDRLGRFMAGDVDITNQVREEAKKGKKKRRERQT